MAGMRLATLVRRLRREAAAPADSSDADLLARFIHARDDAAFELLVWRHGAMVLAACQRILAHAEDAEDAFQAVFLVLARKAPSVARGAALPAWLHRVAVRIAARLARSRRPAATLPGEPQGKQDPDRVTQSETLGALDEEVNRLTERHRRAVVLCYLEGLSAAEAARQLGCPTGTVESRLAAARKKLRDQLTRRGVTLPAGILAVAGHAVLAPEAVARTARASADFARDGAITNELTGQLAKRVLIMWQIRKWASVAVIATLLSIGAGIGWANWPDGPQSNPEAPTGLPPTPAPQAKEDPHAPAEDWPFARRMAGIGGVIAGIAPDSRTLVLQEQQQVFGLDLTEKNGRNSLSFRIVAQNTVHDAVISPNGKFVATAEGIHGVKLRDVATRKVLEAFWPSGKLPTYHVAFTQDGTRLVALSMGSSNLNPGKGAGGKSGRGDELRNAKTTVQAQVSVWDLASGKEVGYPVEFTTVSKVVESGVAAPDYELAENGLFVFKVSSLLDRNPAAGEAPVTRMPQVGEQVGFRFSIIDSTTGKASQPVDVKEPNLSLFSRSTISPDAKTIVATDRVNRNQLHLLDAASGKERVKLTPLLRPVQAVTFSADGKLFAAASGRTRGKDAELAAPSEVVIWEVATGKELARATDKETIRDYAALRFSPDGKFIVVQDGDGALTFWGHPPRPRPEPIKPPVEAKVPPTPPAGVPDRFQNLFQSLSADGVTDQRRVEGVFLAALGRLPTDVESRTLTAQVARQTDKTAALGDLLKTLIDTAEFKAHAAELGKLSK